MVQWSVALLPLQAYSILFIVWIPLQRKINFFLILFIGKNWYSLFIMIATQAAIKQSSKRGTIGNRSSKFFLFYKHTGYKRILPPGMMYRRDSECVWNF